MVSQQSKRTHEANAERYLRELTRSHHDDPDYRVEFACYFRDRPDAVTLLEVSPTVLDPGDEEFYAVRLATPSTLSQVRHVRIILITPEEFERARHSPDTPGGSILARLSREHGYRILIGKDTRYARELQNAVR